MLADIAKHPKFVLSAVDGDFGDAITSRFALAVWLDAPRDVRLERVKERSFAKFGDRVLAGGDLYEQEQSFFDFIAGRSESSIERWANTLACPIIRVDGTKPPEKIVDVLMEQIEIHEKA
jgi:thymidylate kinase